MSFTKILFKLIDYIGYIPQNTYRNKNAITIIKNKVYSDKNPKQCTLDLWADKNQIQNKQPILINMHGGGFIAGDKKYRKSFSQYCLKFNVKVLNVNYGLAPKRNLTEIINELTDIFKWIENNKEKYHLDSDKIILCGDSAGAYFAACCATMSLNSEYLNGINLSKIEAKIVGLVLFSGIYYPTDSLDKRMILGVNHSLWKYLCGQKFVDIASCQKHPLYNHLNVGEYMTADFPPTFISYSSTDIFCQGNGEKFVQSLKDFNIPYYEVCSADNIHDWQEFMFTKPAKLTLAYFDTFMQALLQGKSIQNTSVNIVKGKIKSN